MLYANHPEPQQAHQRNRDALMQALAALGIQKALVTYSGSGDSGDTTEVETVPPEAKAKLQEARLTYAVAIPTYRLNQPITWAIEERDLSLREALEDFTLQWLEQHHGGWENNDGGAGTLTVDVPGNSFVLEHDAYYTESFRYEYRC